MIIRDIFNGEELSTPDNDTLAWSFGYNNATDETVVYAFESNAVLFSVHGEVDGEALEEMFYENYEIVKG